MKGIKAVGFVPTKGGNFQFKWKACPKCGSTAPPPENGRCLWSECNFHEGSGEIYGKVMLCGSVRFETVFFYLERLLTFKGFTVFIPYLDGFHNKGGYSTKEWEYLLKHMFNKIAVVDAIFVVNDKVDPSDLYGYIGNHTAQEIIYATITLSDPPKGDEGWIYPVKSLYPLNLARVLSEIKDIEDHWESLKIKLTERQQKNLAALEEDLERVFND
jgi:hypothetical protein